MDSEDDVFITQSIFKESPENPTLDLSIASTTAARCEALLDSKYIEEMFGDDSTTVKSGIYQPECSDVSDDELSAV
jgi:hypothetical protein